MFLFMSLPLCFHLHSSYLSKVHIFHHFDNICHLLLSLTSLITVNNLPLCGGRLFWEFVCGDVELHSGGLSVSGPGARPDPFN